MRAVITEEQYWKDRQGDFARVKRLVTPILRARNGVDFTHIDDIVATLAARHPELLPTAALLDDADATAYLGEMLRLLEVDDPSLFKIGPTREEFARLTAFALQGAQWRSLGENTKTYYWSGADRVDDNVRRREAYRFRQIIDARNAAKVPTAI